MKLIGDDFRAAKSRWLYDGSSSQDLRTVVMAFIFLLILQLFLPVLPFLLQKCGELLGVQVFKSRTAILLAAIGMMIPTSLIVSRLAFVFAGKDKGDSLQAMALRRLDLGVLGWFVVVCSFLVIVFVCLIVIKQLLQQLSSTGELEQAVGDVKSIRISLLIVPLAIALTVPIAEEFLFRGLLFSKLRTTALGNIGGAIISSGLWACVHMTEPWVNILVIFLMGMFLCVLLLRFGSLWLTIACHCVWNTLTVLAIFGAIAQ